MAGIALGGLASGLDTNTLVTQLMAIERQPLTRLEASRQRVEGRKTAIDDLAVRLRGLNTARADLLARATFKDVQTIENSDAARVGTKATVEGEAIPGTYTMAVTGLAEKQMWTMSQKPIGLLQFTTSIKIGTTQATAKTYATTSGTTVAELAEKINADADRVVDARVSGGQLVLESRTPGAAFFAGEGDFTRDESSPAKSRDAKTAQFSLTYGGQPVTPAPSANGNTVTYGGVQFDLRKLTAPGPPVTVTVSPLTKDYDGIKAKVKTFVESYNAAVDYARTKLAETKVKEPRTASDFAKGALRGDVGLSAVMSNLRVAMGERVATEAPAGDTLAELGISVLAPVSGKSDTDRLAGKLVLDEAKLTAAITNDPAGAQRVFDAIGKRVQDIVEPFAKATTGGILAGRAEQATSEITRIRGREAELEVRLDKREARLRSYFTRLETALQASQAQTAWLQGQIAGLGSSS